MMATMARVAVTGAWGRIGQALVAQLAGEGEHDVLAIDVAPPPQPLPAGVRHVRRDTRDPRIRDDLAGCDALIHLAFRVLDPRDAEAVNVAGSRNVFEGALSAGAETIVHASSGAVYGAHRDNRVPLREDDPVRPAQFAYPLTKVAAEALLRDMATRARVVVLRPTTTLGPNAPLLLGRSAYIRLSDFDPPQQFTWVDDVAAAFVRALGSEAAGVFNVGAAGTVPSSEVAKVLGARDVRVPYRLRRAIATVTRRAGGLHPGFVDMARYPIVVDAERAQRELGWRPRLDSRAALERFGALLRPGR